MIKPLLKDITVEVTNRCQLRCRACGIWKETPRHEISAPRFVRMTENFLAVYRVRFISVTGGEPFLHPGISGILRSLALFKARGRISGFGVYTNGACVSRVQEVFRAGGRALEDMDVGISVDGDERAHDALRGRGAYARTLRTLAFLSREWKGRAGLEVKFTINRLNYQRLAEVYHLARSLGARFSPKLMESGVAAYYHRSGVAGVARLASLTRPMRSVVRAQISGILDQGAAGMDTALAGMLLRLLDDGKEVIAGCATPKNSLFITSRGEIYPCLSMPPAGRVGLHGEVPSELERARGELSREAKKGDCPRCFAYHGFLKTFNKRYLVP